MTLPLRGLRVIDLSKDFAGPFCTMILSDLGAEVLKVEKPGAGDETRSWGPPFVNGLSYYFLSLNTGKKSITLNLDSPTGQKIIRQLVQDSDVLVESFRPGRMKSFNLEYDRLRRINKALVYCSISGFGQTGPYRNRPSYDIVAFALSGIMGTTGEKNRPPVRVSVPVADIAAGHYASTAILASLAGRLVTGRGEYIDLALYDSIVSWMTYLASYYSATGREPERMGSAHPSIVPYQAFKCRDRYLVVAVGNDSQWKSFYTTLDLEHSLGKKRYSTNPGRVRHRQALIRIISRRLRSDTAFHWLRVFGKNNVPCAIVKGVSETFRDPQIKARGMLVSSKSGFPRLGSPMRFGTMNGVSPKSPPFLGQHTVQVLTDLGYDAKRIAQLAKSGTI